ncbi:MAG: hypothetical protein AAF556_13120 [Pseudomonadota bacterium]
MSSRIEPLMDPSTTPASDESNRQPGLAGSIDAIEGGRVYGWAWDPDEPSKQVSVTIYHGRDRLGIVMANRYREDLQNRKVGDGNHAFVFDLPASLRQRPASEFSVYFEESTRSLARGPKVFTINPDGSVGDEGVDNPQASNDTTDTGEIAHHLHDQVRAISNRLEKVDQNYAALANALTSLDQKIVKQLSDDRASQPALPKKSTSAASAPELRKLQRYLKVCWRDIKGLRKDLEAVELFAMRFDERLQSAADREQLEMVGKRVAQAKGLAVVAIAVAALAGLFAGFSLFFG